MKFRKTITFLLLLLFLAITVEFQKRVSLQFDKEMGSDSDRPGSFISAPAFFNGFKIESFYNLPVHFSLTQ